MSTDLYGALRGNFTIMNLGCIGDTDFVLPDPFLRTLTVIEADPGGGAVTSQRYHKKISIPKPISGKPGKRVFRRNNFAGTCSLLEPLPDAIAAYGMEDYCRLIERVEVECETIPDLLRANGLATLDFLKTDIEGLDPEIVASCKPLLGRIHLIQAELRFEPFYQGEPRFHETVNLLVEHGYEVLDILHVDRWRYKTPNRGFQAQGRAKWADFLFVLQPERLAATFGDGLPAAVAKQVILACMLGKKNYGEHLLQRFRTALPEAWFAELDPLTRPKFHGFGPLFRSLRYTLLPVEKFLRHRLGRSLFVATR